MSKADPLRHALKTLPHAEWDAYLREHSGLPGTRANLELVQAAADIGTEAQFRRWLREYPPETAPTNTQGEFLPLCGIVGLGRLLAEGDRSVLDDLRTFAADPRWRVREGVAMALQRWGDADMDALIAEMKVWASITDADESAWCFLQRASTAGLCEPRLMKNGDHAAQVLKLLDRIMKGVVKISAAKRKSDGFVALQKALGYGWSVALVGNPEVGKPLFEGWIGSDDPAVRRIVQENLKKARLAKMDAKWVTAAQEKLGT